MGHIVHRFRCDNCGFECDEWLDSKNIVAPDCPHCDDTPEMAGPVPSTTAIGERRSSKSVDGMYRQMEEGAAIRAEALDDPSMKMTDMKDGFYGGGLKEGDTTAPSAPPDNAVTQYAKSTNFNNGTFWGKGGATGGTTLEAALTKAQQGKKQVGVSGIDTVNAIQGGSGPMQFPARVRPQT